MIALTERILESWQNARERATVLALSRTTAQEKTKEASNIGPTRHPETIESLKEELDAARGERAKLQQAIYEAAQIQRRLCAPRELVCGEFEVAGEIFPVRHLSGDFFKVMQFDSALVFAVGDIAGKGFTAGIWQAHLMSLIQRYARQFADPAVAVAEVNRDLCDDHDEPPMTALFVARLDLQTNELVYCNAGLPAPLILRQAGIVERLEKGGPILGAMQDGTFACGSAVVNPGDMLIAYTDGVTECENPQEEEFEIKRLAAVGSRVSHTSANQALFSSLAAVLDFADTASPGDDLTLLVVKRREKSVRAARSKDFSESQRRGIRLHDRIRPSGREKIPNR